jgi:UDP-glucose 4-epimerase
MTFLITGGAGFIGSHMAEAIVQSGDRVLILDDLSTGSMENIRGVKESGRCEYWIDSLMNRNLLAELVDESDIVIHLAAAVGVRLIVESPVRTIETNIRGTEAVLEAASKKKKLVFIASTSEVYGKASRVPFSEEDDVVLGASTRGRWSYAVSKLADEFLALAYWKEKKLPVIVGRFFNTIGPRQSGRYGMVLPNFIAEALEERPITVFGTGKQSRCFGYVGDAVQAVLQLIQCPGAIGQVINIGNDEEISIEGLAHLVKERTGSRSPIRYIPYEEAYEEGFEDMMRRVPSLEKLEALTGFRARVPLAEIVDRIVQHLRAGAAGCAPPQKMAVGRASASL